LVDVVRAFCRTPLILEDKDGSSERADRLFQSIEHGCGVAVVTRGCRGTGFGGSKSHVENCVGEIQLLGKRCASETNALRYNRMLWIG